MGERASSTARIALEATRRGYLKPGDLMRFFGIHALANLESSPPLDSLEELIRTNARSRKKLLADLGISQSRKEIPLRNDKKIIPFFPLVETAINVSRLKVSELKRVEKFFSSFPYPEAVPELGRLLHNQVAIPRNKIDPGIQAIEEEVIGTREAVVEEEVVEIPGGWHTVSAHNSYVVQKIADQEIVKQTFPAYCPVLEGALASLREIRRLCPQDYREGLEPLIKEGERLLNERTSEDTRSGNIVSEPRVGKGYYL